MLTRSPVSLKRVSSLIKKHQHNRRIGGGSTNAEMIRDLLNQAKRAFFSLDKYYLYAFSLEQNEVPSIQPRLEGITMESVFLPISILDYELLGEQGTDFRTLSQARPVEKNSGRGTIVFMGVKDEEIVYRSCISTFRNAVYEDIYPKRLDDEFTVYQGFNETKPSYRRKGLYSWAQSQMFSTMKGLGYKTIVMLEPEDQVGPRKVQDRIGSKQLCESFALRIMVFINFRWNRPNLA